MAVKAKIEKKVYSVMNKNTGDWLYIAEVSPEQACTVAHWPYEECQVKEIELQRHPTHFKDTGLYVKLLCQICPYQKAECKKPPHLTCQSRSEVPDLDSWLKVVLQAHLCKYVGVDLESKDYEGRRKWVTIETAIKVLTPKPWPTPASARGRPCLSG